MSTVSTKTSPDDALNACEQTSLRLLKTDRNVVIPGHLECDHSRYDRHTTRKQSGACSKARSDAGIAAPQPASTSTFSVTSIDNCTEGIAASSSSNFSGDKQEL